MDNNKPSNLLIPILLIIILVIVVITYFWLQRTSNNIAATPPQANKKTSPLVLGETNTNTNADSDANIIKDNASFLEKINTIRKPANDSFKDLLEKIKYPNLFSADDLITDNKEKINTAKEEINSLSVASKYQQAVEQHIKSLDLLLEALDALQQAKATGDKKQSELFSYKIDQSNKILNELTLPSN